MRKKKLILLLSVWMAAAMAFSACTSATPTPAPTAAPTAAATAAPTAAPATTAPAAPEPAGDDKVEFTIFYPAHPNVLDMNDNYATQWLEDKTGVHVNWMIIPSQDVATRLTLVMASANDMPDIFMGGMSRAQVDLYGAQGLLIPIEAYINGPSVNYKEIISRNPKVLQQSRSYDGNVYFITRYYESVHVRHTSKMWMNQTWLENVGLPIPESTDDFYDVLTAFKDQDANRNGDPNDEIPYIGTSDGWCGHILIYLMNAFVYCAPYYTSNPLIVEDGTVGMSAIQPGWKEGLKFYRKLYEEKLLDNESLTITADQVRALSSDPAGNRIGCFTGGIATQNVDTYADDIYDYITIPPLTGPTGLKQSPLEDFPAAPFLMISAKCADPERAFMWADAQCVDIVAALENGDYEWMNFWYGPEDDPLGWSKAQPGQLGFTGKTAYFKWNFNWGDNLKTHWYETFTINMRRPWKEMMVSEIEEGVYDQERVLYEQTVKNYEPYAADKTLPTVSMEADDSAEYATIVATADTYISESFAKFITGEWDIDASWDNYLQELDKIGVQRMIELAQTAYDRQYK